MPDRPSLVRRLARLALGRRAQPRVERSAQPRPPALRVDTGPRAPVPTPHDPPSLTLADRARAKVADIRRRVDSANRNPWTGTSESDKAASSRPDLMQIPLVHEELSNLWRFGGHAHRFVQELPDAATKQGWAVQAADGPVDMTDEHKRLSLISRVAEADTWGRLYGGAWLVLVTNEGPGLDPSQPLDLSRVRALNNLVVVEASEVQPQKYEANPNDPNYRRPSVYIVTPRAGSLLGTRDTLFSNGSTDIHASRMVYFAGVSLPPAARIDNNGADASVLDPVWAQVRNVRDMDHALALLATEMRITVLKMRGYEDVEVGDQAELLDYRMSELAKGKSILNTVLLTDGEEYQHHPGTVAGMGELRATQQQSLQAVTGMSEQLWLGSAPGGLSSDGDSHRRLEAARVSAYQTRKYTPALEQIYDVIFAAKLGPWGGVAPEGWTIEYAPLDELTDQGTADLRASVADTDLKYIGVGVYTAAEVRAARYGPQGWQMEMGALEPFPPGVASASELPDPNAPAPLPVDDPPDPNAPPVEGDPPPLDTDDAEAVPPTDPAVLQLADRRRVAAELTEAKLSRCEHGSTNRCRLCGVMRRRQLQRGPTGEILRDPAGDPLHDLQWVALDDYDEVDPAPPAASGRVDARAWARGLVAREDAAPRQPGHRDDAEGVGVWIGVPLPESARLSWEAARLEAATLTRSDPQTFNTRGHDPHVTLLWLGKFDAADVASVQRRAVAALGGVLGRDESRDDGATHRAITMQGWGLDAFQPTPGSEGDTPIYVALESAALSSLNHALADELLTEQERWDRSWYQPHATVGYLPRDLRPDEWGALCLSFEGRDEWVANEVRLTVGGEVVGRWLLAPPG